jgi:acyl-ACP thioesterase
VDFTEIVPLPPSGRVFEQSLRPGLADAAPSGRVRMDAIARWVQDMAYADIEDAGIEDQSAWVVRRMRIRVERFPRFRERLHGLTFCSGYSRLWAERRTRFEGGDGALIEVAGLWVHLDPQTFRPVPLPESFDALYAPSAQGRTVKARLRHPGPPDDAPRTPWHFRASDADIADHVNNAAYWEPLEEQLAAAGEEPEGFDAEVEFRDPAQPGEAVLALGDHAFWVTTPDGLVNASLAFRGMPAARP